MNIKLKKIIIENFKGIKNFIVEFGTRTRISGQNAAGKTSIFDAFTWLLFNKNSAGDEKFQVRPLDSEGNRIDNVEIKVVATLDVDGKEMELSKLQKQKWVKKRGAQTAELQGNENLYEVDGYPKSEKDYKDTVNGLVNEDLFRIITNPMYFPNLKWKEQRDILINLVPDIMNADLARELGADKYALLIPELEKAPSTDDIRAKYTKALTEWKRKQTEIPVRIDELSKSIVSVDVAEKELAAAELKRKIADLDKAIEDSGKVLSELMSENVNLQFDLSAIMQEMNKGITLKRSALEIDLDECTARIRACTIELRTAEDRINANNASIKDKEELRKQLGEYYKKELASEFDETATKCKTCGQMLPADKIEKLKESFAERKANLLESIKGDGFNKKNEIEELKSKNATLLAEIEKLNASIEAERKRKDDLERQIEELPKESDYTQNPDYVAKKARHDEVVAKINSMRTNADPAAPLKIERRELMSELDKVNEDITRNAHNAEIEDRIAILEQEQKEVCQKVADQEKMLYLLEEFIREKMDRISKKINSSFTVVNFKLFEQQLNGGIKECCECTVNGVPYSVLNNGHKIVAGLDIINSLSAFYGVSVPIFMDNAECINDYNIPAVLSQLILLTVSDDAELKIEEE